MVRSKPSSSKKPKRGVDFKKIKHKIGRKLPPQKNETDTGIKFKQIIVPEQSVATEKTGVVVNKRGLSLRELLQQTLNTNPKIRRAGLNGIRDLLLKHPSELKTHKIALIEKLRERICDTDKVVRETLFNLFKSLVFPSLKEDIMGPTVSQLMAYILNAMTHIAIEIRINAFKFFELIVMSYPSSFFMHSEKVVDHYVDILRNSQIYLQDKNRLKSILSGLSHCLSLLSDKKLNNNSSNYQSQNIAEQRLLHAYRDTTHETNSGIGNFSTITRLENLVPVLVTCFEESMSLFSTNLNATGQAYDCLLLALQCVNSVCKILVVKSVSNKSCGPDSSVGSILAHLRKLWDAFPFVQKNSLIEKEDERFFVLNIKVAEIFLHLSEWVDPTSFLTEKFLNFIEFSLLRKGDLQLNKEQMEKNVVSLLPYIPRLISQVMDNWKDRLLEAFTGAFNACKVESKLTLTYLSAIEEMILPENSKNLLFLFNYPSLIHHQISWLRDLVRVLLQSGDKYPSITKVVLKILLRFGQSSPVSFPLAVEYDHLQLSLKDFFSNKSTISNCMFSKLPRDCQELAICCLYYFSSLNSEFLESLASCCLCEELDPVILFKIIEVLQSAFKVGHLQISNQIGFLVTLIARFRIYPEKFHVEERGEKVSSWNTYKTLIHFIFNCLSQMGDGSLLLKILWKPLFNELSLNPPIPNTYGILRTIVALDSRMNNLSDTNLMDLSSYVFNYIIASSLYLPKNTDPADRSENSRIFKYLIKPCIFLFIGGDKLLSCILELFNPFIMDENYTKFTLRHLQRVDIAIFVLTYLYNDVRVYKSLLSSKSTLKSIFLSIKNLLDSNRLDLTFDEKQELVHTIEQIKTRACAIHGWDKSEIE